MMLIVLVILFSLGVSMAVLGYTNGRIDKIEKSITGDKNSS